MMRFQEAFDSDTQGCGVACSLLNKKNVFDFIATLLGKSDGSSLYSCFKSICCEEFIHHSKHCEVGA